MIELGYERTLRRWVAERGMKWERSVYERADAGGRTVAYRLTPSGAPRGVVVVAHGAGNDALFAFPGTFKRLLSDGWEVFSFDLDGHGRGSTTVLNADTVGSAVPDAISRARGGRDGLAVHAFGVSLGGALLLHALGTPETPVVSAAIACAPLRIRFGVRRVLAELRWPVLRTLLEQRPHAGIWGMIPSFGPVKRATYPLRLGRTPPGAFGYVDALNDLLADLDLPAAAARATMPVLMAYGTGDRIVPAEQGILLSRAIPDSEFILLRGATHLSTPFDARFTSRIPGWFARARGSER
jgi:alpha-beta hydrolase superfamily lysophospholipase